MAISWDDKMDFALYDITVSFPISSHICLCIDKCICIICILGKSNYYIISINILLYTYQFGNELAIIAAVDNLWFMHNMDALWSSFHNCINQLWDYNAHVILVLWFPWLPMLCTCIALCEEITPWHDMGNLLPLGHSTKHWWCRFSDNFVIYYHFTFIKILFLT